MLKEISTLQLERQIVSEKLAPFIVIYGGDKFHVEKYTNATINRFKSYEQISFSSEDFSVDKLFDCLTTYSFMPSDKLVLIKDIPIDTMQVVEFDKLCDLLTNNIGSNIAVFSFPTTDIKDTKDSRVKKLASVESAKGFLVNCKKLKRGQVAEMLTGIAKKEGKTLTKSNAYTLMDRIGVDVNTLSIEIKKLSFYSKAEITKKDIEVLTPQSSEQSAFDISSSLLRGDFEKAIRLLKTFSDKKESAVSVLGSIATTFNDGYRFAFAKAEGISSGEMAKLSGIKSEYRIEKAIETGNSYPLATFERCIEVVMQTDKKLKSSTADSYIILEHSLGMINQILRGRA